MTILSWVTLIPVIFSIIMIPNYYNIITKNTNGYYITNYIIYKISKIIRINNFYYNTLNFLSTNIYRKIGLLGMIISLLLSSYLILGFNKNYTGFQFQLNLDNYYIGGPGNYMLNIGIDGLSIFFVILTAIIMPIAFLSNWTNITDTTIENSHKVEKTYSILMCLIDTLLVTNFIILDLLGFYIFFESFLAPLFILICLFGASNKERAAYYLLIFTILSSLAMLIQVGIISNILNTTSFNLIYNYCIQIQLQSILWIGIFIAIMVKTPVFSTHVWLSVVHSESFLGGSVILAGIILKLAVYAILRLLLPLLPEANVYFTPLVFVISIFTVIYTSLTTVRQIDTKVIIAYSSIGHMGICLLGIFSNNLLGIEGSILLSLCHGFCSPALFIIIGGILYDRYHTRCLTYYKGLINIMPRCMTYFFIFSLCNTGTPLSGNFLGEYLSLAGSLQRSPIIAVFGTLSVLLSAIYGMYLYSRIAAGEFTKYFRVTPDISKRETTLLNVLLFPILILGVTPNFVFDIIEKSAFSLYISIY